MYKDLKNYQGQLPSQRHWKQFVTGKQANLTRIFNKSRQTLNKYLSVALCSLLMVKIVNIKISKRFLNYEVYSHERINKT